MLLSDFDFELPEGLIATRPVVPRDAARLLLAEGGAISDRKISDLPALLRSRDLLVFNDTRVIPARLMAKAGERKVEILLHRDKGVGVWEAFIKPAKKLKIGDSIFIADGFAARLLAKDAAAGTADLEFNVKGADFMVLLSQHGSMPVPPYFKRLGDEKDREDYQTLFAKRDGAVAAPTASLHFTPQLLESLRASGIETAQVTLHVGAGTFAPVRVDNIEDHQMHAEWFDIPEDTARKINAAKAKGGRIVSVGTTVARALESAAQNNGNMSAQSGETRIFIKPGYQFKAVDILLTNFHLPKSTLLMLVAAFYGYDKIRAAYAHAVKNGYRFYSYGDAMLLVP